MSDKLNTHSYDGKLNMALLPHVTQLSIEEKKKRGHQLLSESRFNNVAGKYLQGIINSIGTQQNIDKTNNINADDLLCLCWEMRHNRDFIKVLEDQLMDMGTCFCPQGRTHRLFQTLLAFT